MATIESVTRRDLRRMLLLLLIIVILVLLGLYFSLSHFFSHKAAATAAIAFEMIVISFLPAWSARIAKLRKLERLQTLAAYKASPESHILHLD